jgi:hypothetical protein
MRQKVPLDLMVASITGIQSPQSQIVICYGCSQIFELHHKLHDLYSSPSIIRIIKSRRMRWECHVVRMGEKRNAYRLLMGKPERKGKRPLGRPRRRLVDNIRMDLGEVGWGDARVEKDA